MSEMEEKKEKGKGKEEEEEVILDHFYHEHPLILTESDREYQQCFGCRRYIVSGETVYKCRDKCWSPILHEECAEMPREIRLSMHPQHTLIQTEDMEDVPLCAVCESDIERIGYYKFSSTLCHICEASTNGIIYKCTKCGFFRKNICITCASLPDTIKHAAHPHHHLKLLSPQITTKHSYWTRLCGACGFRTYSNACYKCGICEFIVHSSCASLPAAVTNPAWDRHHPLPLTFDATLNRPGDFYCDVCEQQMNPRTWMYHCRSCDISFHPRCFPTASGKYRNIKFGQRFVVAAVHPHPVAYQLLTKKLRCDVCGRRKEYGCLGFQCAEDKCYFFMCYDPCAINYLDASLFDIPI